MRGKSILIVGRPEHVPWIGSLLDLAEAAGVVGQTVEVVPDVAPVAARVAAGEFDVVAMCEPEVLEGTALEHVVELAGTTRTRGTQVLVQDTTGDAAVVAQLSHRMGMVELRFGWPIGWVVSIGALASGAPAADLWLRSIYPPRYDDPVPLPIHEGAEAAYWNEVRRYRAARPPR